MNRNLHPTETPRLVVNGYQDTCYNIVTCGNRCYAVRQDDGEFSLERLAAKSYQHDVFEGSTIAEVTVQLNGTLPDRELEFEVSRSHIGTDNFVHLAFSGRAHDLIHALVVGLRQVHGRLVLIGRPRNMAGYSLTLKAAGITAEVLDWRVDEASRRVPAAATAVFCEVPANEEEWMLFNLWSAVAGGKLESIWGITLPLASIVSLQEKFEYNDNTFEGMCDFYTARAFNAPAVRTLAERLSLEGKRVVEFGPSDGVHTGMLVSGGAQHVTAVEARPENLVKLLAAKYAFRWHHVDIVAEHFHAVLPERYGRFDVAYAHGVYYHSNSPLLFLDNLTRLSDVVVIGGWCATAEKPIGAWQELEYAGNVYLGKFYEEPTHFLSGVQARSVYLEYPSLLRFFADRGYTCEEISVEQRPQVTGVFVRFIARKPERGL